MKKEFNKTIIFIGFTFCVIGLLLAALMAPIGTTLTSFSIIPLLAVTFIFAKNSIVKNVGYGLCAINISTAVSLIIDSNDNSGLIFIGVGLVLMFVGALAYFLLLVLSYFGFVKGTNKCCDTQTTDLLSALGKYKDLVSETVLTEEEFVELKKNLLSSSSNQATSIDDLKKWKKAVEQSLITEEEYQNIKSSILVK